MTLSPTPPHPTSPHRTDTVLDKKKSVAARAGQTQCEHDVITHPTETENARKLAAFHKPPANYTFSHLHLGYLFNHIHNTCMHTYIQLHTVTYSYIQLHTSYMHTYIHTYIHIQTYMRMGIHSQYNQYPQVHSRIISSQGARIMMLLWLKTLTAGTQQNMS